MARRLYPAVVMIVLVAFAFIGAGCATCQKKCAAPHKQMASKSVDTDKDGKPDVWYYSRNKQVYKVEVDTNKDGRPDITHERQIDGKDAILIDTDKDGRADLLITGKNGKFESAVVDDNKDGKFDRIITNADDFKKWVNAKDPGINVSIEKLRQAEKGNPTMLFQF